MQKNAAGWVGPKVVEDLRVPRTSSHSPDTGISTLIFSPAKSGGGGYDLGRDMSPGVRLPINPKHGHSFGPSVSSMFI